MFITVISNLFSILFRQQLIRILSLHCVFPHLRFYQTPATIALALRTGFGQCHEQGYDLQHDNRYQFQIHRT